MTLKKRLVAGHIRVSSGKVTGDKRRLTLVVKSNRCLLLRVIRSPRIYFVSKMYSFNQDGYLHFTAWSMQNAPTEQRKLKSLDKQHFVENAAVMQHALKIQQLSLLLEHNKLICGGGVF